MRTKFFSPQSPALNSAPFIQSGDEAKLNQQINTYYAQYGHPFYVILSPILIGYKETSWQGWKDVIDAYRLSGEEMGKFEQRYQYYLRELGKYQTRQFLSEQPAGKASQGALLTIESYIYYPQGKWQARYGDNFLVSNQIKTADKIEADYKKSLEATPQSYKLDGNRFAALQNYVTTIINSIQTNSATRDQQRKIDLIIAANNKILNISLRIQVAEPVSEDIVTKVVNTVVQTVHARKYYLNPDEQRNYDSPISDTEGGGTFFLIDDFGYIDLGKSEQDPQKASIGQTLIALQRSVTAVESAIALLTAGKAISTNISSCNCEPAISKQLKSDADNGILSASNTIQLADQKRHELHTKLKGSSLSEQEKRLSVSLLYYLNVSLKYVFSPESTYPFHKLEIKNLPIQSLGPDEKNGTLPVVNPEQAELDFLEAKARTQNLSEEELQKYTELLCKLKKDCRTIEQIKVELQLRLVSTNKILSFSSINRLNYISYFAEITDLVTASKCNSNCTVVALSAAKKLLGLPILDASKFSEDFVGQKGVNGLNILKEYVSLVPANTNAPDPTKIFLNQFPHRINKNISYPLGIDNRVNIERLLASLPNNTLLIFASSMGANSLVRYNGHAFNVIKDETGIIKYFDVQVEESEEYGEGMNALLQKMEKHGYEKNKISNDWYIFNASTIKK